MEVLKINKDFRKLPDAAFQAKARQIGDAMDGNAHFPNPTPSLAEYEVQYAAFVAALTLAMGGGRVAVALKKQQREKLNSMLNQWANYVQFISNEDYAVASTSMFPLKKQPEPTPPLQRPEGLRLEAGETSGQLVSQVDTVKGARGYVHQYTTDATLQNWQSEFCTRRNCTFSNLQPGTRYFVRVGAMGTNEQVVYSVVQSMVVN